jgi:hypothetical protein
VATSGRLWVLRELAGKPLDGCDPKPAELEGYMLRLRWQQPCALEDQRGTVMVKRYRLAVTQ